MGWLGLSKNPKRTRRRFTAGLRAVVALAALTQRQPLAEQAARYQLSVSQIIGWKPQVRAPTAQVFAEPAASSVEPLYAAIGKLQLENQLLKKGSAREGGQRALVQANAEGVVACGQAVGLARSSSYYRPQGETEVVQLRWTV